MNKIAIIVTTIKRDEMMMKCVSSHLDKNITTYLLDQGEITLTKKRFYKELENRGNHIYCISKDFGIPGARKFLVEKVTEPFVLVADDDIELISNPNEILYHFNENSKLGIVGGCCINKAKNDIEQHYEYALEIKNQILYLKNSKKIDLVLNFFVARRELFNDIQWDERLKLMEHLDFFLQLKELDKWDIIYDKELLSNHYSYGLRPSNYSVIRRNPKTLRQCQEILYKKWNYFRMERDKWRNII